jgi:carbon-monoxide dehydrogenase large subunit
MKFGTSQSVARKEDVRLVTGHGRFIDDAAPEGALHATFYRSPMAHARIGGLDVAEAAALPGVLAVYTAADFAGKMKNAVLAEVVRNRDGSKGAQPRRPVLAEDRVRHVAEAIAVVIAETRAAGLDALDLIACDFEELPAHVETAEGGEAIHPEAPANLAYDWAYGDEARVTEAFAAAARTTELELVNNRVIAAAMEARGCFAEWDGARLHVAYGGQGVWMLRDELAANLGLD